MYSLFLRIINNKSNYKKIINYFLLIIAILILTKIYPFTSYYYKALENKLKNGLIIKKYSLSFIAGGVVPHHLVAEKIIKDFFEYISSKENPDTIVLLGPDHFKSGLLCNETSFISVSPEIKEFNGVLVDTILLKQLFKKNKFCLNKYFISLDHSITNLLPYIKFYFPKTKIIPILIPFTITEKEIDSLIESINLYRNSKTIIIGSVDFSHYLPKDIARFHDLKSIRVLLNFEGGNFRKLEVDCWQCLYGVRRFARLQSKEDFEIIGYGNSVDFVKKESDETTSYFSVVFKKGSFTKKLSEQEVTTLLFVGDVIFDEKLNKLLMNNNFLYPFEKIKRFLQGIDLVVGGLEISVDKNSLNKNAKFNSLEDFIASLSFANFNLLLLSNGYSFNIYERYFNKLKEFLFINKINFLGDYLKCDDNFLFENDKIILLYFNKNNTLDCEDYKIIQIVKNTRSSNSKKFIIVAIKWIGDDQTKASDYQRRLAHKIIESGADLIIGMNPRAVKEIEEYKGKLIFYSLGNFIYSGYISEKNDKNLILGLEIYPEKVVYRFFPIKINFYQPSLMDEEERNNFLKNLLIENNIRLFDTIKSGIIKINR